MHLRGKVPVGRNVLFITMDQWRGDCLSALGHPIVFTPALDRLASAGVLFSNHWANAAPCGPSRACLYTGTYLFHNRSVANATTAWCIDKGLRDDIGGLQQTTS